MPVGVAVKAIGIGLAANTAGKLVAADAGGGRRFAGALLACFAPAVVAVAGALLLFG